MTTLYNLALSRHIKGFGKPAVRAVPAVLAGHVREGELVRPNADEIRECLPHYYRKAFDRSGKAFWFTSGDNDGPAYCTLRDTRGRYLNTIYATPYEYRA